MNSWEWERSAVMASRAFIFTRELKKQCLKENCFIIYEIVPSFVNIIITISFWNIVSINQNDYSDVFSIFVYICLIF